MEQITLGRREQSLLRALFVLLSFHVFTSLFVVLLFFPWPSGLCSVYIRNGMKRAFCVTSSARCTKLPSAELFLSFDLSDVDVVGGHPVVDALARLSRRTWPQARAWPSGLRIISGVSLSS